MTEVSNFFGITIRIMPCTDGQPHFHANYQNYESSIDIMTGLINGRFPPRAMGLVQEWLQIHRSEVMENWHIAASRGTLKSIEPLF